MAFTRSLGGGPNGCAPPPSAWKARRSDIAFPAEFNRGALVYPACDADRSSGPHRGRLYCSWLDLNADGITTGIMLSFSDDRGGSWAPAAPLGDRVARVDRFNHSLAGDPVTRQVTRALYDR